MFLPEHYKHELGVGGFERLFFSRKNTNYNSPYPPTPSTPTTQISRTGMSHVKPRKDPWTETLGKGFFLMGPWAGFGKQAPFFCSPWGIVCPLEDSLERAKEFYLCSLRNKSKTKMEGIKRIWGLRHSSPSLSECGHRNPAAVQTQSSSLLGLSRIKRMQRQEVVVRDRPP